MNVNLRDDIQLVQNVRRNSYVKEEIFTVGAVIKTKNGKKYTGCNIETCSKEIIWAEKVAIAKSISEGEKEFDYLVITAGKKTEVAEKYLPSKECLEFIKEFVDEDFKIYVIYENKIDEYNIKDLI